MRMKNEQRLKAFEEHKQKTHHRSPFQNYFKEVIYGGIDGIITTFAVVAGFSGAALANDTTTQLSFLVVLLFGLANLFADGVSMGLGNFLSVKSDHDLYGAARKREEREVEEHFAAELEETVTILMGKGYSQEDATALATLYTKNKTFWVDFMMEHEHEMSDPRGDNPVLTGFATFCSFIFFGAIPILPFLLMGALHAEAVFFYSILGTAFALILLGILKWKVVGSSLVSSLVEVLAVGGTAATIAFFVGTFFKV
jgi:VIT1/CCC1 family predicted Fe2+/Mn2+ transporter